MMLAADTRRLRRYVLGTSNDAECDAIEREYFAQTDALDCVRAAEDDLIDDYLSDRLTALERDRFERHYLAAPTHRTRVIVMDGLRRATSVPSTTPRVGWWAAVAAGLVLVTPVAAWLIRSRLEAPPRAEIAAPSSALASASTAPPSVRPPDAPVRSVAAVLTLSPIHVRSTGDAATLVVPPGTDLVVLRLQEVRGVRRWEHGSALVRTVGGREVWRGSAVDEDRRTTPIARIEVPSAILTVDDYIVELRGVTARGREMERHRYFLRVRP